MISTNKSVMAAAKYLTAKNKATDDEWDLALDHDGCCYIRKAYAQADQAKRKKIRMQSYQTKKKYLAID